MNCCFISHVIFFSVYDTFRRITGFSGQVYLILEPLMEPTGFSVAPKDSRERHVGDNCCSFSDTTLRLFSVVLERKMSFVEV